MGIIERKISFDYLNIGTLIIVIGFLVAVPLLLLPFYPNESHYWFAFAIPAAFSFVIGAFICLISKKDNEVSHRKVNIQKDSLTVLLTWVYGFLAGAAPFIIAGELSPLHALFEAVSGWTTTGLSVMDLSATPKIFLFHRSFIQFCGGLGFVLVMLMFIHSKQSMNLYSAEGHSDNPMANLKKSAQFIFIIYGTFTLIGVMAYCLSGMEFFDALLHSMCALSTGGFSTQLNGIGEYNSMAIEAVSIFLMLIGATSFATLLLLPKRKWKQVCRISEIRFMFVLLVLAIPFIALSLISTGMDSMTALRVSTFNTISVLTTTGYSTVDFAGWTQFALGILIIFMLIGGGLGSTAGGMKLSRVYILLRIAANNLVKKLSPKRSVKTLYYMKAEGKTSIDAETVSDTTGFFLTYICVFITGVLALTLTAGCSLLEAGFEFASALGTVGLSLGITSASSSGLTLVTLIFGMILGRLEIFIVLIGIYSGCRLFQEKIMKRLEKRMKFVKE